MARVVSPPASPRAPRRSRRLLALRSDDRLVELLRAGEPAAFEVLYERHGRALLGFCRHMLGSLEEAEDAVQHSFAAAHADLLRTERAINFKPWLYTIARNRALSVLRARREELGHDAEPTLSGLQEEVQQRADLRELVADIADLPEDQRAALVLSELGDLSHAEIATVLDCEATQVKGLVHRARAGLIERRDARSAACEDIRAELATARGGTLRRGRLRHHLKACPECSAFLEDVRSQRRMLAMVLPVIPSIGLKDSVLAAVGGGAATVGGVGIGGAVSGVALKIAAVAALATGGGVVAESQLDGDPTDRAPARQLERPAPATGTGTEAAPPANGATGAGGQTARRRASARAERRRAERRRRKAGAAPNKANPAARPSGDASETPRLAPSAGSNRPAAPPAKGRARRGLAPPPAKGRPLQPGVAGSVPRAHLRAPKISERVIPPRLKNAE